MKTFEQLGVNTSILKAIEEMGYASPMPVQAEVIPYLLGEDNDVIALAQTGTGKTAAFGLPILQKIDVEKVEPQALVLCPTRELCLQIADDLNDYSKYINNLKVLPVYGGSSIESQIKSLKRGVHLVVATPGRLLDLMNRKTVSLKGVNSVVLDEADEMLNMGFTESINEILAAVPEHRNMLLFSATMPQGIAKITKKYMKNHKEIVIGNKNEGNKNIKHIHYMVQAKDKYLALKRLADFNPNIYGIVFCRTRKETQEIADKLIHDGYNADSLHGELSQAQRDAVMQKFRIKNIQLLVATDVAARGLDVDDLSHVIHYGLPDETESYTHRSGRTGRAGKTGISIAICHAREKGKIRQIEQIIGQKLEKGTMPSGQDICQKQIFSFVDQIEKVKVNDEAIEQLMPTIYRKLEWLDKEDIIKRMVWQELNRMIDYYQDADEIAIVEEGREKSGRGERRGRGAESGYARLFINFGKLDKLNPGKLMELVNKCVAGRVEIGRIDLRDSFSFFEVPQNDSNRVMDALNSFEVDGRRISVEEAQEKGQKRDGKARRRRNDSFYDDAPKGKYNDKPWRKKKGKR